MSAIGKITPVNKVDLQRCASPEEISKYVEVMYFTAKKVFDRATTIAELCRHKYVHRTHLLAAMLPAPTFESASGVPQILSGAGLDYERVLRTLKSQAKLEGLPPGGRLPLPSKGIAVTLGAALARCELREAGGAIITADMAIALLYAVTTDPLLRRVLREARVDIVELRRVLRTATADQPQVPMLIGID